MEIEEYINLRSGETKIYGHTKRTAPYLTTVTNQITAVTNQIPEFMKIEVKLKLGQ